MTASMYNGQNGNFGNVIDGFVYPQFIGYAERAPTSLDIYNPGSEWQNNSVSPPVIYKTSGAGRWYIVAGASGTTAAMVAGEIAITDGAITADSVIVYSRATLGGTVGHVSITAQAAGTATLTSASATETSTFNYTILN